jgi:hypothetical protein
MECDHYQTIAEIDGNHTGNSLSFAALSASGQIPNVVGLRGVALRVHLYNDSSWKWTFSNMDAVDFTITSSPIDVPGDLDSDGDVDPLDMIFFEECQTGPGMAGSDPDCAGADLDDDNDIDAVDFGILQRCLSGIDQPGDPGCAGL